MGSAIVASGVACKLDIDGGNHEACIAVDTMGLVVKIKSKVKGRNEGY